MYVSVSGRLQLVKQHLDAAEPQPVASVPPDAPPGHRATGRSHVLAGRMAALLHTKADSPA